VKVNANGADAKDQNEEIKGIERPAKKAGDESIPLDRRQVLQGGAKSSLRFSPVE
jgi:hypothetical protein